MARSNNFQVRVTGDTTKFDAAMNKAQRELQSFSKASKAAFAVVGVTSFTAALGSLAKTIGDFERANSELAAVLGTNLKGIEALTKSAKDLGRTSEFTASDVTKLQIALSRLGFTETQILQMQGSVLNFALAMGTDLASAADFAGASLRAFGLEAKDTEKLLDVMSAATTNSALDFTKLQASISVVAPIAKSFGLDVQETAAFLGVLSNNGFDASSAATALRNILLNLSDANGKLSKGIGHSAKSFDEIIAAFNELQEKGVDVGAVLEMTDKRSAAAAVTLINQADAAMQLKEKLDDSTGSLQNMADTMSDNLVGSTKALGSAWEGFVLALEDSKGPMKDVVDGLTDILNRLTDIISKKDDVTWWEAVLGPITGGLIASRQKKNAGNPLGGGAGASGMAEGGGGRGGSEAVDAAALKELQAKQKLANIESAIADLEAKRSNNMLRIAELNAQIAAQQEIAKNAFKNGDTTTALAAQAKARELINEKAELQVSIEEKLASLYKAKNALTSAELSDINKANQQAVKAFETQQAIYEEIRKTQQLGGTIEPFNAPLDPRTPKIPVGLTLPEGEVNTFKEHIIAELGAGFTIAIAIDPDSVQKVHDITNEIQSAIENLAVSVGESIGAMVGALVSGEDPWQAFANTALAAIGDMAVSVGKMAIATGTATLGIKAALESLNGYAAIAAGIALVALGSAVKAGLSSIASGNYSASTNVASSGSYSSGINDFEQREVTVNVTGTLQADGDQLVAVINNSNKKSYYTT